MRETPPSNSSERREMAPARLRAEAVLETALAGICTDEQAERAIDQLENVAGELHEEDFPEVHRSPRQQASAIAHAAGTAPSSQRPAAVIAETAAQIAKTPPEQAEVLDQAIAGAAGVPTDGELHMKPSHQVKEGRRLLRRALFRRLKPLDAIDATVFLQINHMPHPPVLDSIIRRFSFVMTFGVGWIVPLLFASARNPRRGTRAAVDVVPALTLVACAIEGPIKSFFRRKRPFSSIVRAIVVGRKPGSYSFPSGHTAAAFAGASLLADHFPKRRSLLYAVAALVGFSRIYLGAHYPGDVLTGGVAGATLARGFRRMMREFLDIWSERTRGGLLR